MKPVVVGVDASALVPERTGIGNYVIHLLDGLQQVAGNARFILYSNTPIATGGLGGMTLRAARPAGRRGLVWLNTQLGPALFADRPDLFWGASGVLPLVRPGSMRTVVTIHDLVYRFAGETLPLVNRLSRRLLQPWAVRTADQIVAVSEATAADMRRIYRRDADAVIHPIVGHEYGPAAAGDAARVAVRYDLPTRYLLTLGTLEPRKNLGELVQAVLLLRERGVVVPPLIIAGGRGWLDGELTRVIAGAEATGVARRLGYVDNADMPGLYAGAQFFVAASRYEGFGMPIVEAQLCGTAVIASNIPSFREASGGRATLFEPTAAGIADTIGDLIAGRLATLRRPVGTIDNDPVAAAKTLWSVMNSCL